MEDRSANDESLGSRADNGEPLQFLPINRPDSPPQSRRRRAYQSCEPCRRRKSRCVPDKPGQRQPCKRCVAEEQRCEFRSTRALYRRHTLRSAGSPRGELVDGRYSAAATAPSCSPATMTYPVEVQQQSRSTSVPAAGGQGNGCQYPNVPATGPEGPVQASPTGSSTLISNPTARSRIVSAQLHNTADALDLLTFAAASEQGTASQRSNVLPSGNNTQSQPLGADGTMAFSGARGELRPRDPDDAGWERFLLIRRGIMTKHEAVEYLDFYFNTMWSLRPVIPCYYRDRSRYVVFAVDEPLLLLSLITLSSRYHPLSGLHGEIRSERIHWQAWRFLQRHLQSAFWGSPHTRSPGAIAAMLLMMEWHTKSINNPVAFYEEEDLLDAQDTLRENADPRPSPMTSLTSQQRYGMSTLLENLNIVAPAYRSNKMSWMLLSTAIALAQEGCCFDYELQSSSSSGAPAGSEKEQLKQQWNQSICVFIYLADEHLSMRLGLSPLLPEGPSAAVRDRFSTKFASLLPDSALWESYYDLCAETKKARTLLQSLKKAGWPTMANVDILPELEHIDRALNRWKRQHTCLSPSKSKLLSVCLDLEYHYSVMYSFAPASYVLHNSPSIELDDQKAAALSRLANQASQASHQMLSIVINVLEPSKLTKYLPVRCWLFIVAANLHLLKSTLTANPHVTESHENVRLLRASIMAIRGGSPDDTHMAMRYSRFLEILLNASLYSSRTHTPAGEHGAHHDPGNTAVETQDANWAYSILPPASALDNLVTLDIPCGLAHQGDLIWDGIFGMAGAAGFQ